MIIEFFGVPAAGKSTAAEELIRQARAEGLTVSSRGEAFGDRRHLFIRLFRRAFLAAVSVGTRPRLSIRVLIAIWMEGSSSKTDLVKLALYFLALIGWYSWNRLRLNGDRAAVADQGLLQAVWSVRFDARRPPGDWIGLLRDYGLDDIVVVHCRVSPSVAAARLDERGGTTRLLRAHADKIRAWDRAIEAEAYVGGLASETLCSCQRVVLDCENGCSPLLIDQLSETLRRMTTCQCGFDVQVLDEGSFSCR